MKERLIEVVEIKTRREAIIGDHYRYASFDAPMPSLIQPNGEVASFLDTTFEELSSPIKKICFRDPYGYVTEKFMCLHPRDKEEISLLIDMQEANRFKEAKKTV